MQNEHVLGRSMAREFNPSEVSKVDGAGMTRDLNPIYPTSGASYYKGLAYSGYTADDSPMFKLSRIIPHK